MKLTPNQKNCLLSLELFGLYAIAVSLPAIESIKWVGLVLFILGLVTQVIVEKEFKWRRLNGFEWILLALLSAALLSTAVNWPLESGITGLKNVFLYLLLGWLLSIRHYTHSQQKYFLFALIIGVLIGLGLSALDFLSGKNPFLEFKSIPNLNRSVIYHLTTISVALGILLDNKNKFTVSTRIWIGVFFVIALISLLIMGSRAGIITFFTGTMLLLFSFLGNRRVMTVMGIGLLTLIISLAGISLLTDNRAVKNRVDRFIHYYQLMHQQSDVKSPINTSNRIRYDYLRVAWAQITQSGKLFLGSGPATFGSIPVDKLKFDPPLSEYNKTWDEPSHAHNEYLNLWVEKGLIGLIIHIVFLIYLGGCLWRHRSKEGQIHWQWVTGLGIFNIAVVAGLFNTVLSNEPAWQVMLLIGLFIRWAKNPSVE